MLSRSKVGGPVAIIRKDWGIPASPILIWTIDIDKPLGRCQRTWSSSAGAAVRLMCMGGLSKLSTCIYIQRKMSS